MAHPYLTFESWSPRKALGATIIIVVRRNNRSFFIRQLNKTQP
jgi:hypothetical protein